jgi:hypothetical protein
MTDKAERIVQTSLTHFFPRATVLTWREFCSDCPKGNIDCFPCRTAQTMIKLYLSALVEEIAKHN